MSLSNSNTGFNTTNTMMDTVFQLLMLQCVQFWVYSWDGVVVNIIIDQVHNKTQDSDITHIGSYIHTVGWKSSSVWEKKKSQAMFSFQTFKVKADLWLNRGMDSTFLTDLSSHIYMGVRTAWMCVWGGDIDAHAHYSTNVKMQKLSNWRRLSLSDLWMVIYKI